MAKCMHQGKEDQVPAYHLMKEDAGLMVDASTKRGPFQNRGHCLAHRKDENGEIEVEDQSSSVGHVKGNSEGGPDKGEMPLCVGIPEAVSEDHAVEEGERR